ncbi:MAG TPA: SGNH/GDSL hydrolase family protein [Nitrospiria bacterium]|nr:SGNH/GDSL hydrolase family protein [Nitrospiria bacterium]
MTRANDKKGSFLRAVIRPLAFYTMAVFMAATGCGEETVKSETVHLSSISDVPLSDWQKLSRMKIYFGHQSVGNNIMDGIAQIMKSNNDIKLNIVKIGALPSFDEPVFAHEEIGKNEYPLTKTKAFRDRLQNGLGDKVDVAFLKFCFWDIRSRTDIQEVFKSYKETIAELQAQYPRVKFVYFTVPLMIHPTGLNAAIHRLLHRPVAWDQDNIKRNELNRMIREEYGGKGPLFDIAALESTLPDGRRAVFSDHGKDYYYLDPEYSNDGGHLNEEGRKRVAEQLLIALARLSETH